MTIIIPRDETEFRALLALALSSDYPDKTIHLRTDTPYTSLDVPEGLARAMGLLPAADAPEVLRPMPGAPAPEEPDAPPADPEPVGAASPTDDPGTDGTPATADAEADADPVAEDEAGDGSRPSSRKSKAAPAGDANRKENL